MPLAPATPTQQDDNDRVRITRWHLPPDSETGHHVHEYDYVVVPLVTGALSVVQDNGEIVEAPLTPGGSYFRRAGVSHNVTNRGAADVVFIEVELK